MEKYLYILRGVPGCGKSTVAETLATPLTICTADDYHMKDGKYDWKSENVPAAHEWCRNKAEFLMKSGFSPVVVANTSTTEKEFNPYHEMAEKYGYTVFSLIVENRHGGVNTHEVPEETLEKMKNRFEIKLR